MIKKIFTFIVFFIFVSKIVIAASIADAVAAYNAQYGTNYTVESAKEALGQ